MSTYKVIQDIEAEDKLVGPLSFRQFIYFLIAAFLGYLSFISLAKGAAIALVVLVPPMLFCLFFCVPWSKEQQTEVWALAKIRFYFKPRKRIWNQSGVKELVTITVPKRVEVQLTDGLSQLEVKSRLKALADTIDTRGWAIKNVAANAYVRPGMTNPGDSERLLSIASMPQPVPDYDFDARSDILDEQANPIAQQFSSMIQTSTTKHRNELLANLSGQRAAKAEGQQRQWFAAKKPAAAQQQATPVVQAQPTPDEASMLAAAHQQKLVSDAQSHLHQLQPAPAPAPQSEPVTVTTPPAAAEPPKTPVTPTPDAAILNLAKRNDLNVSTLAREANKAKGLDDGQEVVISLH